jgi:predicted alpha/beta-hydrolase family hydrolase
VAEPVAHEVDTPHGPARLTRSSPAAAPVGRLVVGHGAGGLRWTDDVLAVREAATALGWVVDLVDQPWRVAGRRVGPGPAALDAAWLAVLDTIPPVPQVPLVLAGRSAGARVACRTAQRLTAAAVLALSFPLHPPGRPERSRADELAAPSAAGIGVHVVQGRTDPFGTPDELRPLLPPLATLAVVTGPHSLERAAGEVATVARGVLRSIVE